MLRMWLHKNKLRDGDSGRGGAEMECNTQAMSWSKTILVILFLYWFLDQSPISNVLQDVNNIMDYTFST